MAITSKPVDGEALIEPKINSIGQQEFVGARQLLVFFDDIVLAFEGLRQTEHKDGATSVQVSRLRASIDNAKKHLKSEIASVEMLVKSLDSKQFRNIAKTKREITQKIGAVESYAKSKTTPKTVDIPALINGVISQMGCIKSQLDKIESRISNIEQTSWR